MPSELTSKAPTPSLWRFWFSWSGMVYALLISALIITRVVLDYYLLSALIPLGDALQFMDKTLFAQSMGPFILLNIAYAMNTSCLQGLVQWCQVAWHASIMQPLCKALYQPSSLLLYFSQLDVGKDQALLQQEGEVAKRVQEDAKRISDQLRSIVDDGFRIGKLLAYSFLLYTLSPSLVLWGWIIPKALFLIFLLISMFSLLLSWCTVQPLFGNNRWLRRIQGGFRAKLHAFGQFLKPILHNTFFARGFSNEITKQYDQNIRREYAHAWYATLLTSEISFLYVVFAVLPYFLVAPVYFDGLITLGVVFVAISVFAKLGHQVEKLLKTLPAYSSWFTDVHRVEHVCQAVRQAQQLAVQPVKAPAWMRSVKVYIKDHNIVLFALTPVDKELEHYWAMMALKASDVCGKVIYLRAEGGNGSGKTRSLYNLNGLEKHPNAICKVDPKYHLHCLDQTIPPFDATTTIVQVLKHGGVVDMNRACHWLTQVALFGQKVVIKEALSSNFNKLSYGQKRKVILVKTLLQAQHNAILLADEVFNGLDCQAREVCRALVEQVVDSDSIAGAIMVDHTRPEDCCKNDFYMEKVENPSLFFDPNSSSCAQVLV